MKNAYLTRTGLLILPLLLICLLTPLWATDAMAKSPVATRWEFHSLSSDKDTILGVLWITPQDGFHAYGNPPGDTGLPTTLKLSVHPDGSTLPVFYPAGEKQRDVFEKDKSVFVYEGETPLFVHIPLEHIGAPESRATGTLKMLLCSATSCWPARIDIDTSLSEISTAALTNADSAIWWPLYLAATGRSVEPILSPELTLTPDEPQGAAVPMTFSPRYFAPSLEVSGIGKALLFAFLAGFILNFMPCVLPVVSLKISALMSSAGEKNEADRIRMFREHNLFFSLGILLYFGFLAAVLSSLGLAWGQLFQTPELVLGATAVVFALSLSLFGVFDLPVIDLKPSGQTTSPRLQAIFTGILATLLATPCSGPFLGGVLGWVLMQPPFVIALVFICIGLGMCSPFILMAIRPGFARSFPKPGAWMGYLETAVGLFLMATCVYLLSIIPQSWLISSLALLWVVAVAAWIWGKWTNLSQPTGKRWSIRLAALALILIAWPLIMRPASPNQWDAFSQTTFENALGSRPVVIDFTADWCPNCKVLEKTTLSNNNLTRWKKSYGLTLLQADLTDPNPRAMELLQALGSQSIPVVAIFPTGDNATRPIVLRDIFTPSQMDEALREALGEPDAK